MEKSEIAIRITFFLWVFIAGVIVCLGAVRDFSNANNSTNWPAVTGVVLKRSENGSVNYAYSFEGRNYNGSRRRFATAIVPGRPPQTDPGAAGSYVLIRVSPNYPSISVIEPGGVRAMFAVYLIMGSALAFVGAGGFARSMLNAISAEQRKLAGKYNENLGDPPGMMAE